MKTSKKHKNSLKFPHVDMGKEVKELRNIVVIFNSSTIVEDLKNWHKAASRRQYRAYSKAIQIRNTFLILRL